MKEKRAAPGTRVDVFSADQKEHLGPGTIEEWIHIGHGLYTPSILLDDGTEVRGYECWWHPLGETVPTQ